MNRDDTDLLDALDRRLDPLVPRGPAPVADVVRRGRARRTRRRGLVAGLASAVAVATVVTATSLGGPTATTVDHAAPTAPTPPTTNGPVPGSPGTWRVGDLLFTVPAGWFEVEEVGACSGEDSDATLALRGPDDGPAIGRCPLPSSLQAFSLDTSTGGRATLRAVRERTINGLTVLTGNACPENASCLGVGRFVAVPELGIGLHVFTPVSDRRDFVEIVASLRSATSPPGHSDLPVPDGYRLVGLEGVAVAIPADWVGCPIREGLSFGPPDDGGCASPDGPLDLVTLTRQQAVVSLPTTEQNGLQVLRRDDCGAAASCVNPHNAIVTSAVGPIVSVLVGSSDADLVAGVADSVRAMPDRHVAVPDIDLPSDQGEVCRRIPAAGLAVRNRDAFCIGYIVSPVVRLDPAPGEVVQLGTTVSPRLQAGTR